MTKKMRASEGVEHAAELRQRALAVVRYSSSPTKDSVGALSPDENWRLVHELRVHQIELEMQNDELRRAQIELDASRTRYFDLYDLAPVGYFTVCETSGRILQANLAAATLLGVVHGELIDQPVTRFILRQDQDTYYLHRRRLMATDEIQWCDLQMVKSDGTPFWAQMSATTAIEADGAPVLRIMVNDISERKNVEGKRLQLDEVLKQRSVELESARLAADKANREKSEFLNGIGHELRVPLDAILGCAQRMKAGAPSATPVQQRDVDQILKAGCHLRSLIDEILDLALIESGKLSLSIEPVSLSEIMLECESLIEPTSQRRGIDVIFPRFEQSHIVRTDRNRVRQVLINLVSNAIEYNSAVGTVVIDCAVSTPESIRISVRDTGASLTQEQLAQLFQPFNPPRPQASQEEGGGIGLVVSKRLVELMGGAIGVRSLVGEGSMLWVDLPLMPENDRTMTVAEPGASIRARA